MRVESPCSNGKPTVIMTIFGRYWAFATLAVAAGAAQAGGLLVGDFSANRVVLVNDINGQVVRTLASGGGLDGPLGVATGPDGLLYVASYRNNQILRYNDDGTLYDIFATTSRPHGISFIGEDLVVANHSTGTVTRYGQTPWISPLRMGRSYHSVVVRQDRIFVSFASSSGGGIEEFDPLSGRSLGDFIPATSGLRDVQGFAWSYDGDLYVTNSNTARLFKFDGVTGAPKGFMRMTGGEPLGVRFTSGGDVVSTSWGSTQLVTHSPMAQAYIGVLVRQTAGLVQPFYMERVNPTIECRAVFQGWQPTDRAPSSTISVELRRPNSPLTLISFTVPLRANGRFEITAPAFLGEYDLWIKTGTFLGQVRRIDTRDASQSFPVFQMLNGDADGSGVVDTLDWEIIQRNYNKVSSDANWDPRADLDGNGEIGANDYSLFAANFRQDGAK